MQQVSEPSVGKESKLKLFTATRYLSYWYSPRSGAKMGDPVGYAKSMKRLLEELIWLHERNEVIKSLIKVNFKDRRR